MMPDGDTISCSRLEPRAEREDQEQRGGEPAPGAAARAVPMRRPNGVSASWPATKYSAGDADGGEQHERRSSRPRSELEHRQREDVERRVVAEDRIGLAERHLVPPREQRQPLARRERRDQERRDRGEHQTSGRT